MNILQIHNEYRIPGGEDVVVKNEELLLKQQGHKVITYKKGNRQMEQMPAWRRRLLPFTAFFSIKAYRDVRRIIKKEDIDIVHVHNIRHLISPSVYYAAFSYGVPVVQTVHNYVLSCPNATAWVDDAKGGHTAEKCLQGNLLYSLLHTRYRDSFAQTLHQVATMAFYRRMGLYKKLHYICLTAYGKEQLLGDRGLGICTEQVYVKANFSFPSNPGTLSAQPYDTKDAPTTLHPQAEDMTTAAGKDVAGYPSSQPYYLYLGRLEREKGILFLLHTWNALGKHAPALYICGAGSRQEYIEKYLARHPHCNCRFLGQLPHREATGLLASATALIVPSLWAEPQGLVVAEAYAQGTPVIASRAGGLPHVVREGITGYTFTPGNQKELTQAIARISSISRENVRKVYQEKFSPKRNMAQLLEIYHDILNKS